MKSVIAKYSTGERHLLGLNLTEHRGQKAEKRERKLGKIAHDILVPTRLCSAVFTALTCHVIRAELFVDKQDNLSKTAKFAIKAPLFAARNILATTSVGLKTPELLSMPIARGMKFAATTVQSAFNSAVAKMRANLENGSAQVKATNKPKPVSIYANRGSKNNGRSM